MAKKPNEVKVIPRPTTPGELQERKAIGKRQRYENLRVQLENERSTFISHWRDLGDYILPRRPRFTLTDVNKGDRRNQKIIDSTATLASRTLRSGMMAGVTSPSRPWFRLTTGDPDLDETGPVKDWLHICEQRINTVLLQSNCYNALPIVYADMGVFGTAAVFIQEDIEDVVRFYTFPVGSYMIANNSRLKVDVFFREFRLTVRQVIEMFAKKAPNGEIDWSNLSDTVKNAWLTNQEERWIDICHCIMPNPDYVPNNPFTKFKRYISCYYEKGQAGEDYRNVAPDDTMLRESGYDYFPVLCPRWEVTDGDAYGTSSPGMEALGDVKALQLMHKRKAQAIEKHVNPPMKGPPELRSASASIIAGNITYTAEREGQKGFTPIHEVDPRIQEMMLDIRDHQDRVRRAFYEDLFLMLAQSDRREFTAEEIRERKEEKMLAVGPVLEQLNQDLLDPMIDIVFDQMVKAGMIPEPPEELQGRKLKVEYISIMAQAQKLAGIGSIERFTNYVANLVKTTGDTTILDKLDADQLIDEYGMATGVPPRVIRTDEAVEVIRQQRAKAAQARSQSEAIAAGAKSVKDLSQANMGEDSALTRLLQAAKAGQVAVPTQ